MSTLTSPGLQYYDHFIMKEIPEFKQTQNAWNKEINDLRKEVNQILKDLDKIANLKAGISVEEKALIYLNILRDYSQDLGEFQSGLSNMIQSLHHGRNSATSKIMEEEFRKDFRQTWHNKLLQMNLLLCEFEPLKKESEVFVEAIFFIFDNYSKRSALSRFNSSMIKPINNGVFQPLRKLVQSRLELSHF